MINFESAILTFNKEASLAIIVEASNGFNAKNVVVEKFENLYKIKAKLNADKFVCSILNGQKTDVVIGLTEKDILIDNEQIKEIQKNFPNNFLKTINVKPEDFYVQEINNQQTSEIKYYLMLKKGNYTLKTFESKIFYVEKVFVESFST